MIGILDVGSTCFISDGITCAVDGLIRIQERLIIGQRTRGSYRCGYFNRPDVRGIGSECQLYSASGRCGQRDDALCLVARCLTVGIGNAHPGSAACGIPVNGHRLACLHVVDEDIGIDHGKVVWRQVFRGYTQSAAGGIGGEAEAFSLWQFVGAVRCQSLTVGHLCQAVEGRAVTVVAGIGARPAPIAGQAAACGRPEVVVVENPRSLCQLDVVGDRFCGVCVPLGSAGHYGDGEGETLVKQFALLECHFTGVGIDSGIAAAGNNGISDGQA